MFKCEVEVNKVPLSKLYWIILMLSLVGCGPGQQQAKVMDGEKTSREPAKPLPTVGQFYTAGLPEFASQQKLTPTPLEEQVSHLLRRTINVPPSFQCLAREYAARFGADGADPAPHVVHSLANHCGYWTRPAAQYSVTGQDLTEIQSHLRTLPVELTQGAFAVGAVIHPDDRQTVSILIPSRNLELAPFPREGPAQITGRLLGGDGDLEIWSQANPTAQPTSIEVKVGSTGRFSATIETESAAYRLEFARRKGNFRETLANFERGDPAPSYRVFPKSADDSTSDVLAAINGSRDAMGLPRMAPEAHLNIPMQDWLSRMKVGKASDDPPGLLDQRGWRYARQVYGFSYGQSAEAAIHTLRNTPTGFRLLTSADHDRLAIGVLPFERGPGFDVILVAVSRFEVVSASQAREQALALINQVRESQQLKPLRLSSSLSSVTQTAAEAVLSGQLRWEKALPAIAQDIGRQKLAEGAFGNGGLSVAGLSEIKVSEEPPLMSKDVAWVGLGIASGPTPGGGTPRYIILYAVAEKAAKAR